jgi:PAS domain S-box-containing protein
MKENSMPDTDMFFNSIKRAYFLFSRQIDGSITSVSSSITSMLGYDRHEFMKLFADSFLQDPLQNKKHPAEYEMQVNHKNGSPRWLKIVEMPVLNQAGEIKAFDCMAHDITKHKNTYNELLSSEKNARNALGISIRALAASIETRDYFSNGHQQRASSMARLIAQELGVSAERTDTIRLAAVIHDIGKITIPTEILNKKGLLSDTEYGFIHGHPEAGYNILRKLDLSWPLAEIVLQHHEKLDGSGYPYHLQGDQILPETKILTVADVIEAMASDRAQRPAMDVDSIMEEITAQRDVLYDPDVVDVSLRLLTEKKIVL